MQCVVTPYSTIVDLLPLLSSPLGYILLTTDELRLGKNLLSNQRNTLCSQQGKQAVSRRWPFCKTLVALQLEQNQKPNYNAESQRECKVEGEELDGKCQEHIKFLALSDQQA